ncbi:uncharacterized protein H6S33_004424 [Morchella sextelata]|uniref:uncharacterized protein n=1 Tax=Morchella sextelata TaxID=1174677 RepID=UPI001D050C40|nr:uncharacterized protein H6S33_004424 [Morchella sextelata]KAH0605967.1 hypothetical protein H6S33_004424 [Morchella sextelata]
MSRYRHKGYIRTHGRDYKLDYLLFILQAGAEHPLGVYSRTKGCYVHPPADRGTIS